jgi:hypothetical protein
VPDVASVACFVKVTVEDSYSPAQTGTDRCDAAFTIKGLPAPLNVTLSSPNGGENWTVGTVHNIGWTATGGVSPLAVKLEYSTTGPNGTYTAIAAGEANDGTHSWTVPDMPSTNCFVRVSVNDSDDEPRVATDQSNSAFIIGRPFVDTLAPVVSLTAPADRATVGGVVQINVTASDNVRVVRIEVLIDGASFVNFSQSPAGTNWNTKTVSDGTHVITARAYDAAGNAGNASAVTVVVKNAKGPTGEKGFLEQYGLLLMVLVIIAVAVMLLARMMRKRPAEAPPATAPVEGPGTTLPPPASQQYQYPPENQPYQNPPGPPQ